jgi:hypothetical protein
MVLMLLVNDQHRPLIYPIIPAITIDSSPGYFCVLVGIPPCTWIRSLFFQHAMDSCAFVTDQGVESK